MARVKMNAKQEYEYLGNFKVLQNVFKSHKIDKVRARFKKISILCHLLTFRMDFLKLTAMARRTCSRYRLNVSLNARCSACSPLLSSTPASAIVIPQLLDGQLTVMHYLCLSYH